jgi:adenylylsulfate kinase
VQNLHPIFEKLVSRDTKEKFLNQNSIVIWFTGLSGSGKSTIVQNLEKLLSDKGYFVQVLDGDNIRTGICNNLGFSKEDRNENIRRVAEISNLFKNSGIITLCSFISPTSTMREMAEEIVGIEDFREIFVDTPLEICENRDVKGLYKKARAGEIKDFTGIDAPYDKPENPFFILKTENQSIQDSVQECFNKIENLIKKI